MATNTRKKPSKEQRDALATKKAARKTPERRKPGTKGSISLTPSDNPDQALQQVRRSFGSEWVDDPANPAVSLLRSESQLCGRLNVYDGKRWSTRRLGDDAVVLVVKLKDGSSETRKFSRGVLSAEWKRS